MGYNYIPAKGKHAAKADWNTGQVPVGNSSDTNDVSVAERKLISNCMILTSRDFFKKVFRPLKNWMGLPEKKVMNDYFGHIFEIYERVPVEKK